VFVDAYTAQFVNQLLRGYFKMRVATGNHQQLAWCHLRLLPPRSDAPNQDSECDGNVLRCHCVRHQCLVQVEIGWVAAFQRSPGPGHLVGAAMAHHQEVV